MQTLLYLKAHWHIIIGMLIVIGLAVAAYIDWQFLQLDLYGPRDTVGNGITVGLAKAFDNRSLSLRIEQLSNNLAQLRVVDQKATESIGKFQGESSHSSTQELTLKANGSTTATAAGAGNKTDSNKSEAKPEFTLTAGDILSEQLNLASQIVNLQTLYERSLTDRLIGDTTRLQTVLGFQVSITPPAGFENSAAIVEVAVRMSPTQPNIAAGDRVSLVALIPQEKTYNSQSISTNSQSIGGSAVASVVSLGVNSKGESRQLFVHRDSDIVAFERKPTDKPCLFEDDKAIVFGWEFRPVLGHNTVAAGVRQMLAVIALPHIDKSEVPVDVNVEIKTRSYWRRYDYTKQTSRRKWHWYPRKTDGSGIVENEKQELAIPNTAKIHTSLTPKIERIDWYRTSPEQGIVTVKGENLFSGTRIIAGGQVYREDDGTLVSKSDKALEFEIPLRIIVSGDVVISGRFGPSFQLKLGADPKWPNLHGLYITSAVIKQSRHGKFRRITLDVKGLDAEGEDTDLSEETLEGFPQPLLFIGEEQIPPPYEYFDAEPKRVATPSKPPLADPNAPKEPAPQEFTRRYPSTKKWLRVEAWIPSHITVSRNSLVRFRVPFCGLAFQSPYPLEVFEPSLTRLGSDEKNTVFRIAHSLGHERPLTVEIDRIYDTGPELVKVDPNQGDYRLTISNKIASNYRNLVLRIAGHNEPYVIAIPGNEKPDK